MPKDSIIEFTAFLHASETSAREPKPHFDRVWELQALPRNRAGQRHREWSKDIQQDSVCRCQAPKAAASVHLLTQSMEKETLMSSTSLERESLELLPSDRLRPLGAFEELFSLFDQHFPTDGALAAQITGSTTVEQWRGALHAYSNGTRRSLRTPFGEGMKFWFTRARVAWAYC